MDVSGGSVSEDTALVKYIKEKLECNICLSYAGSQAVQTVCGGNHTFCFRCIVKYATQHFRGNAVRSMGSYREDTTCPVCRRGECSVIPSIFLKELGELVGAQAEDTMEEDDIQDEQAPDDWLTHFKEKRRYMKRKFPFSFKSTDDSIITSAQMVVYWRYREDIMSFIVRSYRLKPPPFNTSWLVVIINNVNGDFCCTSHSSIQQARLVLLSSPPSFTQTFLCMSRLVVGSGLRSAYVILEDRPHKREVEPPVPCEYYFAPPRFTLEKSLRITRVVNQHMSPVVDTYPPTDESENETPSDSDEQGDITHGGVSGGGENISWLPL